MADLFTSCTPFWDLILKFKIFEIQINYISRRLQYTYFDNTNKISLVADPTMNLNSNV